MVLYILCLIFCLGTAALGFLFGSCGAGFSSSAADRMFFRNVLIVAGLAFVTSIFLLVKVIVLTKEGP
jgi:hypothetical protein